MHGCKAGTAVQESLEFVWRISQQAGGPQDLACSLKGPSADLLGQVSNLVMTLPVSDLEAVPFADLLSTEMHGGTSGRKNEWSLIVYGRRGGGLYTPRCSLAAYSADTDET